TWKVCSRARTGFAGSAMRDSSAHGACLSSIRSSNPDRMKFSSRADRPPDELVRARLRLSSVLSRAFGSKERAHADEEPVCPAGGEAWEGERRRGVPRAGTGARESGDHDADLVRIAAGAVHVCDLRRVQRRAGPADPSERSDCEGAHGKGAGPVGL